MTQSFLSGRVVLHLGDCREVIRSLADGSIDSVVTDPPYALVSIGKRFGADGAAPAKVGKSGAYARASAGFMGKKWDTGEVAFDPDFWTDVLRVLKPGGHVVAFGGTRSYHRLACAIEDAGFEIRDQMAWAYGSGFPKSHSMRGIGRPELGTALKPAWEPIVLARKPLSGTVAANVLAHGTGALNIDGCRVETSEDLNGGTYAVSTAISGRSGSMAGPLANAIGDPFVQPAGRWPANIVHDGSDEVVAAFPDTHSAGAARAEPGGGSYTGETGIGFAKGGSGIGVGVKGFRIGDAGGSAARFFYSAKADANDRIGSKHPTVKPVDLMQWLCRLVTPPGGTVLDPFAGTGTTGEAAWREGFKAILIEREADYQADIARRMKLALAGPDERARESLKANGKADHDAGPLFGGESA